MFCLRKAAAPNPEPVSTKLQMILVLTGVKRALDVA